MAAARARARAAAASPGIASARGPPVVLVHGTPSWSYLWRRVVPLLARRLSVYVLDLLGYGGSERREGQDISITPQGRVLATLAAYLRPWQGAEGQAACFPGAELVLVAGAGHSAPEDAPEAVADALTDFLAASLARSA